MAACLAGLPPPGEVGEAVGEGVPVVAEPRGEVQVGGAPVEEGRLVVDVGEAEAGGVPVGAGGEGGDVVGGVGGREAVDARRGRAREERGDAGRGEQAGHGCTTASKVL
ncbi:hypothetical protein GCM10010218_61630 [Streptomyces mashuensis]|uniref:Uncharacterized protein n=1 Tax=Streptomyces mashuensis TaxID=33904 RepID=A0A919BA66_9ACTN|nr:hypothetical protein GCM10010218_61630 [Streptomyces mashuensis]